MVRASLPGVKPDDVQITIQGDALTIRGEAKGHEEQKGEPGICASAGLVHFSGQCRWALRSTRRSRTRITSMEF